MSYIPPKLIDFLAPPFVFDRTTNLHRIEKEVQPYTQQKWKTSFIRSCFKAAI